MKRVSMKKPVYLVNPELVERYEAGVTMAELAHEYECSAGAIRSALVKAGVEIRRRGPQGPTGPRGSQNPERDRRIVELCEQGLSATEIAREFGVTHQRISQIVAREGGCFENSPMAKRRLIESCIDDIAVQWLAGATQKEIADEYGVGRRAIHDLLKQHGIKRSRGAWSSRARDIEMMRLQEQGASLREVAEQFGLCSPQHAWNRIRVAKERLGAHHD